MVETTRRLSLLEAYYGGARPLERDFVFRPPVALVDEAPGLDLYLKAHGMKMFEIEGIPGEVVCPEYYEIHLPPILHGESSAARYYIHGQKTPDGDIVFLSLVPPNSHTSDHHHEDPISEDYFKLFGDVKAAGYVVEEYLYVPPETDHQITTVDSNALLLIVLRNGTSVPEEEWHKPKNLSG